MSGWAALPLALGLLGPALLGGPARAEPIHLTDMRQRSVVLPAPAARIVALPLPSGAMLMASDQSADRLVGLHPSTLRIALEGPLARLFPALRNVKTSLLLAGGSAFMPNVEALAALAPDLVVQRGERGDDIVAPLEAAGLTTLLVTYEGEEQTRQNMRLLGAAIGAGERSAQAVAWRIAVADRIAAAVAGRPSAPRPRVLFLSRSQGGYTATGGNTPNDFAITLAGGTNLAGDLPGSVAVSVEQLLLWDPDVILLNSGDASLTPAALAADPVLSMLTAVTRRSVYKAPTGGYRWEPPGPENPLLWLWLAEILHPARGAQALRADLSDGFGLVYGSRPTEAELGTMLQMDTNAGTAAYAGWSSP